MGGACDHGGAYIWRTCDYMATIWRTWVPRVVALNVQMQPGGRGGQSQWERAPRTIRNVPSLCARRQPILCACVDVRFEVGSPCASMSGSPEGARGCCALVSRVRATVSVCAAWCAVRLALRVLTVEVSVECGRSGCRYISRGLGALLRKRHVYPFSKRGSIYDSVMHLALAMFLSVGSRNGGGT